MQVLFGEAFARLKFVRLEKRDRQLVRRTLRFTARRRRLLAHECRESAAQTAMPFFRYHDYAATG